MKLKGGNNTLLEMSPSVEHPELSKGDLFYARSGQKIALHVPPTVGMSTFRASVLALRSTSKPPSFNLQKTKVTCNVHNDSEFFFNLMACVFALVCNLRGWVLV